MYMHSLPSTQTECKSQKYLGSCSKNSYLRDDRLKYVSYMERSSETSTNHNALIWNRQDWKAMLAHSWEFPSLGSELQRAGKMADWHYRMWKTDCLIFCFSPCDTMAYIADSEKQKYNNLTDWEFPFLRAAKLKLTLSRYFSQYQFNFVSFVQSTQELKTRKGILIQCRLKGF